MRKKCTTCSKTKDETKFYWKSAKHKTRYPQCKKCRDAVNKRWRQKNLQHVLAGGRRRRERLKKQDLAGYRRGLQNAKLIKLYGITIEQYEILLAAQNSLCAICGKPETILQKGKLLPLSVDHDHTTNKNRALLCGNCNRALGLMGHNPERLEKAAAYLRYHGK